MRFSIRIVDERILTALSCSVVMVSVHLFILSEVVYEYGSQITAERDEAHYA